MWEKQVQKCDECKQVTQDFRNFKFKTATKELCIDCYRKYRDDGNLKKDVTNVELPQVTPT